MVVSSYQTQRVLFHIGSFVYFQHHRLVGERAVRGFRVTVWFVDTYLVAIFLEKINGKFNGQQKKRKKQNKFFTLYYFPVVSD